MWVRGVVPISAFRWGKYELDLEADRVVLWWNDFFWPHVFKIFFHQRWNFERHADIGPDSFRRLVCHRRNDMDRVDVTTDE